MGRDEGGRILGFARTPLMVRWGRRILLLVMAGWLLLLATRCHLPRQTVSPTPDSTSAIYVVQHGWHAGIAVRRSDVPDHRWPTLEDLPDARYLEIGWGEAKYYPGMTRGVWGMMRAGLWPTGSVVHAVPVPDSVSGSFPRNRIVRVPVGPTELDALAAYVAASFAGDGDDSIRPVAVGLYVGSHFYPSSLTYHAFNNCNHWAAGALEAAGCDTAPRWTFTVGQVMRQARDCGTLVQETVGE